MATVAIGDIHGNASALRDLLTTIRTELDDADTVVFLGDYIDRGDDSKECIDAILEFRAAHAGTTVTLRGNHEDWLLEALHDNGRHSWLLGMDGFATIRSYSAEAERLIRSAASEAGSALYLGGAHLPYELFFEAMPESHLRFFEELDLWYQDEHGIYVHAGLDPTASLSEQTTQAMVWGQHEGHFPDGYSGEQTVVYGHRNDPIIDSQGWPHPRVAARTIGLDTSHYGVVSAVRLPDRRVFQSRQPCPL